MARGTVKVISAGAVNPGDTGKGSLDDIQTGLPVNFEQAYFKELGLDVGSKVTYETVLTPIGVVANCVRPLERGKVISINPADPDRGVIQERGSNAQIPFVHCYTGLCGIVVNSIVSYEKVLDGPTQQTIAVALIKIK